MSYTEQAKQKEKIIYYIGHKRYEFPLQNSYGSHLPLLLDVIAQTKPESILEVGCGECSTPILAAMGKLEIIEQGEEGKYDPQYALWVRENFPGVKLHIAIGKDAWRDLMLADHYDLVFIDGHQYSRVDIANWAVDHSDVIILHDTEPAAVCYGWDRLAVPWHRFDYKDFIPNSTVFSKQKLSFYD